MTIQQCRYVIKIASTCSFNEAANSLFISQAALSGAIKELECELGIKIFQRTNRGVVLTDDGAEFLSYARQVVSSADVIKNRYESENKKTHFSVSSQHYDFVAKAFVELVTENELFAYNFQLKETKTYEVIDDVKLSLSEIGILAFAKRAKDRFMDRFLKNNMLEFNVLFETKPHIFVRKAHPLADKKCVSYDELTPFTYITYDQGKNNSPLFSEELTEMFSSDKTVTINDRATLMNFLLGADAYTIGTGVMPSELNNGGVVSVPINTEDMYVVGWVVRKDRRLSDEGRLFVDKLKEVTKIQERF